MGDDRIQLSEDKGRGPIEGIEILLESLEQAAHRTESKCSSVCNAKHSTRR